MLPAVEEKRDLVCSFDALRSLHDNHGLEEFDYLERGATKKMWFMFEFSTPALSHELFKYLGDICDVIAIGVAGGSCQATVICHRVNYVTLDIARFQPGKFYLPIIYKNKNANDVVFVLIKAWMDAQAHILTNFFLKTFPQYEEELVMIEWQGRTEYQVVADIGTCRHVVKVKRTPRQSFIAARHVELLKLWHCQAKNGHSFVVKVDDSDIMNIRDYTPAASEIMLSYVDVSDGSVKQFSVRDWIVGAHMSHTAVLYGGPRLGKTPLAKSMAACVAPVHHQQQFIMVSTLDVLPQNDLVSGVPILLDEFNPSAKRGTRPAHSCEDLKVITEIAEGGTINGRGSNQGGNIQFPKMVPRVITCNAKNPFEFFPVLPPNLFTTMTNNDRLGLHHDAKAVIKRCAFLHIEQSVVPLTVSANHSVDRRVAVKRRAAELYSGANAIP